MKTTITLFSLAIFVLALLSFDNKNELLNHPMPLLANKTLDGKTIDADYYRGHVTVVSFMYIGCFPCMNEISVLNKINDNYKSNRQVQVLCVAKQMRQQMIEFNSDEKSLYSAIRKAESADPIRYSIQPACKDTVSKTVMGDEHTATELKSECNTIETTYGFTAFPTIFFVDKKGIIRKIHTGGPDHRDDAATYNSIKTEVEALLAE